MKHSKEPHFAICVNNSGYDVSLVPRKLYELLPDPSCASRNLCRIIDESGEDYCYPASMFVPIALPKTTEVKLRSVA
jgi:hypothetical protein